MTWKFYIDALEVDEPIGFSDLVIRIKRDENWHGVFFEASTSELQFYGAAADYLKDLKVNNGFNADSEFRAVSDCGGENEELFKGKLDFRQYKEKCGNDGCLVIISVEQEGCIMTLRNRYDQKVDLTNQLAFDKFTVLQNYAGLNFPMELAAQNLRANIEGYVKTGGEVFDIMLFPNGERGKQYAVRPDYEKAINQSINTAQLTPSVQGASDNGINDSVISPVLLLDDQNSCYETTMPYEGRIKGSTRFCLEDDTGSGPNVSFNIRILVVKGVNVPFGGGNTVLHTVTIFDGVTPEADFIFNFDLIFSGTTTLLNEQGIFAYFLLDTNSDTTFCGVARDVTFDQETYIKITSASSCPATNVTVSLIHETASRVTEAITDLCLKVKSDYYGRIGSEPYAATEDGCGSLRVLTSGLRLRIAENPTHFLSLKGIFDSLNAIDNIGMGIEGEFLRIEPAEYFYQDAEIIKHPSIPKADFSLDPEDAYSIIKVGYKKWETESINGLDEFNSNKEFRTSLKSISKSLEITSDFIAGGYPIENTRQQSFADTGAADTKYDNDTFIICVERMAYDYIVEQGNIVNAANMYSSETAYNWRIRPMYNLMRWWKSIAQSYVNLVNSTSKLIFSSGTGNILAEGQLSPYDSCTIEAAVLAENDDLFKTAMQSGDLPIWKPEKVQYRYPMSLKDYNLIKSNPLGYVNFQCSNNDFQKGFIENINYRVAKGEADITLKLKWE